MGDETGENACVGDSEYARHRTTLFKILHDLKALGATTDALNIPRLAVIGCQSAGKSSLVEAVTGVKVPRDDGMCTRCPMECTILSGPTWSCTISLRISPSPDARYSPVLSRSDDVELWIRRAQATLLCPHLPRDAFKTKNAEEIKAMTEKVEGKNEAVKTVVSDSVVISIEDPAGADLIFVDLPGLVENEDREVIRLIRNLVTENIKHSSTFILVTVPAVDNIENQRAMRLAKEADPEGKRTIGIVTKPDTVAAGATDTAKLWRETFAGTNKHKLGLGYYAVRLALDVERKEGISRADLSRRATRFFAANAPWKDIAANRLGLDALVRDVSALLMSVLIRDLPKLMAQVTRLLASTQRALASVPAPPLSAKGATADALDRIVGFCVALSRTVHGRADDRTFVHRTREAYLTMKHAMRASAPEFWPFDTSRYGCFSVDDAFALIMKQGLEMVSRRKVMGLVDVRKVIKECTGWELPGHIPFDAKAQLIKGFVDQWEDPSATAFERVTLTLESVIAELIEVTFGTFPKFKVAITALVAAQMKTHAKDCSDALMSSLDHEQIAFFTQNVHYLRVGTERWHEHYQWLRYHQESSFRISGTLTAHAPYVSVALGALRTLGYPTTLVESDFRRLLPVDEYKDEILVMAEVRAFFHIAYKRIIDHIPTRIQHDFVQKFADGLQGRLLAELAVDAPGSLKRFESWMEEDPEIAVTRKRLTERMEKLMDIQTQLEEYSASQ
ncbi:P-loop containing nucleoside triphosphate hydrolase protein [Epithele typhae]|uniref:P-loop containing nucleoside triphosphate hydrolase protein n=1 Tax=Epithele typhae TaxID=378194 RepID=UPI002008454C|nr:P-loop containing nucleoside triphosphate hydrolase protein [Epithele typhae]KAH9938877.1 P-loop containing nucleoside triphosphate hydrolase protein [Epithele typhae]